MYVDTRREKTEFHSDHRAAEMFQKLERANKRTEITWRGGND